MRMEHPEQPINVDCIMPAAGLSSRMGCWKLMLPYNDSTILEASIKNALSACSRVILVVGHRSDEIVTKLKDHANVDIVVNQDYQQGMFSSIQCGLKHVNSDYFFITHADMPCIDPSVYHHLWQKKALGSVFPGDEVRTGHPVLISHQVKSSVLEKPQQHGMKAILRQFPTQFLNLANCDIHFDVDTPAAYEKLCQSSRN